MIRNCNMYKIKEWRHMSLLRLILYLATQRTGISIAGDVCSTPKVTATADLKLLFSPNFPKKYPNNRTCNTSIISPKNTVIEVEFHTFELDDSEECVEDFLKITDKAGVPLLTAECVAAFRWPRNPQKVVSRKNHMTIIFNTDDRIRRRGFNATFRAVQPSPQIFVMAGNSSIRAMYRYNANHFYYKANAINEDPLAVDYDPRTKYIFYSDRGLKTIGKFHPEGRFPKKVLHSENVAEPFGLRIDVMSRLLYWTDAELGTISVSNLDGEYRNTLVETELEKPGAIVTEAYRGYIYFTDWGNKPKIERADGDGQNRVVLVKSKITSPRSLAIDLKERALYWIDSFERSLQRVNYDGTGRTFLKYVRQSGICSLVLDDEAFFWIGYTSTDESKRYIYSIDRKLETERDGIRWGLDKQLNEISLRPYQESGDSIPDTCPTTECDGLCLPKPNGHFRCLTGNNQITHTSPIQYLVICIGGALTALVCIMAVTVYVCKFRRRHNRNQAVEEGHISHSYSGDLLVSGGTVHYTSPQNEPYYSQCIDVIKHC